jgi:hypothetical protein
LFLLAAAGLAAPAAADEPAAGPAGPTLSGWRTAPIWGADVRSVALHPDDPDTLLAGTSAGQLYLSDDAGRTWTETGLDTPLRGWVVSDLAWDPDHPGRLWAALWGVWGTGTVVVSDDLGGLWQPRADGLPGGQVYTLAPVPGRPGRLYAGTRSGVYGTADGGAHWRPLTAALPEMHKVTSLLLDPASPDTVIAGTWQRAYRSDDAGATWRGVFDGMILDSEVFSLTRVPGRPQEVWASTCGWVYRSLDGGLSWSRRQEGLDTRRTPSFAALPSGRLAAGTVGGLYLSDDGGAHWRLATGRGLAVLDVAVRGERVVLATEGSGVWISDDGAGTFRRSALGMTNVRVGAIARVGRELLVAVNHAGPASGIYSSTDGGRTFDKPTGALPTVLSLTVSGYRVFAGTERGLWERSGAEWRQVGEVGEQRIEQVAADGERVIARAAGGLWELADGRFRAADYHHGPARSAALVDRALWVTDDRALYRLTAGANHTLEAPIAGGRLDPAAGGLLLSGAGGVWVGGGEGGWRRLAEGAARVHPTGDPRYPALVVTADGAFLAEPASGLLHPVALPVQPREVTAASLDGDRLVVGTSGYGLLLAEVAPPAPEPAPAGGGAVVTAAPAP